MTEKVDDDNRKRLRAAENLGWLATSGTYSKKRKLIEGADLLHMSEADMLSSRMLNCMSYAFLQESLAPVLLNSKLNSTVLSRTPSLLKRGCLMKIGGTAEKLALTFLAY